MIIEAIMRLKPQGIETSPIWLIGDSDPKNWGPPKLEFVFDDRHPTIHNIWTSIIYKIQKKVYKQKSKMIDDGKFYIRNAIGNADMRPKPDDCFWNNSTIGVTKSNYLTSQMNDVKYLINKYEPKMIITFGAFAFEFIRRCNGLTNYPFRKWRAKELKNEFINSINNKEIIIPLLHRSISMGFFLSSHKQFSHDSIEANPNGNYFEYVSEKLYKRIIEILKL
jgi:hypothetical protein